MGELEQSPARTSANHEALYDDLCEGMALMLDTLERMRGKRIRAAVARKVVKDLLRTHPDLVLPLIDKYSK